MDQEEKIFHNKKETPMQEEETLTKDKELLINRGHIAKSKPNLCGSLSPSFQGKPPLKGK